MLAVPCKFADWVAVCNMTYHCWAMFSSLQVQLDLPVACLMLRIKLLLHDVVGLGRRNDLPLLDHVAFLRSFAGWVAVLDRCSMFNMTCHWP